MMTPGFGEAHSSEHLEQVASGIESSHTQTESGLYVPRSVQENQATTQAAPIENQVEDPNTQPVVAAESDASIVEEDVVLRPETGEAPKTTEDMALETAENLIEVDDNPIMQAESEEDFIKKSGEEALKNGATLEEVSEAEKQAKKWLDRAAAIAGMTFNEFKQAHEGSSMDLFIKNFLVFDVEGRFGGTSAADLKDTLKDSPDDQYLDNELSRGDSAVLVEFFRDVLEKQSIQNLDEIKSLIKEFNIKAELNWQDVEPKLKNFLDKKIGYKENRNFNKIRHVFIRLEGMNPDNILKYFNISKNEEESEGKKDESTQGQTAEQQKGKITQVDFTQAGAGNSESAQKAA